MMRPTRVYAAVGAAALMTALAACGSSGSSGGAVASSRAAGSSSTQGAAGGPTLSVVKTSLGSIVAGPDGHTVYMFGKDAKGSGKSACTGPCLTTWPPVLASGTPKAAGISGKVGTITTADGKKQVTLGGWPLYYYAGDSARADVTGQGNTGFGGVWRALDSQGAEVTKSASGGSYKGGGAY